MNILNRREPCSKCQLPVYLAERIMLNGQIYHRSCFRCARCSSQLTTANFYETENGEYCCETCPDEEINSMETAKNNLITKLENVRKSNISDEEKLETKDTTKRLEMQSEVLENKFSIPSRTELIEARNKFVSKQIFNDECSSKEKSFDLNNEKVNTSNVSKLTSTFENLSKHSVEKQVLKSLDNNDIVETKNENFKATVKELYEDFENEIKERDFVETKSQVLNLSDKQNEMVPDTKNIPETIIELENQLIETRNPTISLQNIPDSFNKTILNETVSMINISDELDVTNLDKGKSKNYEHLEMINEQSIALETHSDPNLLCQDKKSLDENVNNVNILNESITETPKVKPRTKFTKNKCDGKYLERIVDIASDITSDNSQTNEVGCDILLPVVDSKIVVTKDNQISQSSNNAFKSNFVNNEKISSENNSLNTNDIQNESTLNESFSNSYEKLTKDISDDVKISFPSDLDDKNDVTSTIIEAINDTVKLKSVSSKENYAYETSFLSQDLNNASIKKMNELSDEEGHNNLSHNDELCHNNGDDKISYNNENKFEEKTRIEFKEEDLLVTPESSLPYQVDDAKDSKNPFDDSDSDLEQIAASIKSSPKKLIKVPESLKSSNPFDSESDEDDDKKEDLKNPFDTEEEEIDFNDSIGKIDFLTPIKKQSMSSSRNKPEPSPRFLRQSGNTSIRSSLTSLSSIQSTSGGTVSRKKKPAPKPPISPQLAQKTSSRSLFNDSKTLDSFETKSLRSSYRKNRPAPPPPTNLTLDNSQPKSLTSDNSELYTPSLSESATPVKSISSDLGEKEYFEQKEIELINNSSILSPDKSSYGKWKRKKGHAPIHPLPSEKRQVVSKISLEEIKQQLEDIEIKQQGLEQQGVRLEQIIRDKCERTSGDYNSENNEDQSINDSPLPPDLEDLVLQLFDIVNEKNELFRKQAELMYLRRQHRLEEEYTELEYKIHCLMQIPESKKTDSEKSLEENLIKRLIEVVEQKNDVIRSLDMDRQREIIEDSSINEHLAQFTARRYSESQHCENVTPERRATLASIDSGFKEKTHLSLFGTIRKKEKKFLKKLKKNKGDEDSAKEVVKDNEKSKKKKWFGKF